MLTDNLKTPMLGLYYLATLPQRQHAATKRESKGQVPVMILYYHRVADQHPNDWTISNELFQSQIRWLQERFDIVSLEEGQRRIAADHNDRSTVCVTFDDGYADNYAKAIPWLLEQQVPFTYFVTSDNVQTGKPFDHDVANGCPLPPNTVEQLREMADAGVEIGAHTRSHADLGSIISETDLYDEIVGSKLDLESLLGQPVRYFAFPFGMPENLSSAAFRIAFQAGLWGVCSAYGGYNLPGEDAFHIQRIHGDPEWTRFRNWLTVDPRKLRRERQFKPGDYRNHF
ncbi:MAG: polysaccharide deacetylase family protein [Planctomycetales bacterium]|nr:polysaccharide deacetylase family protein [Planctomycetales bacterium]